MNIRAVLFAAAVAALPAGARAYCIGWDKELPDYRPDYYSAAQEFARAKYVVEIQVTRETWLGEDGKPAPLRPPFQNHAQRPWGFDPYIGAYYDAKVVTAYKGSPPKTLRLFSENSTARFWLKKGGRYLAFVTEEQEEWLNNQTVLTLDTCGNMAEWTRASKALRVVRRLASPHPSSPPQ